MARRQAPTAPLAVLLVTLLLALLQAPQALAQAREVLHMGGDGETEAALILKVALPKVHQVSVVEACRMDCPVQYQDPRRYLCPKLGQCLVRIGCSMKQRVDVAAFCSRRGYCKDGYCNFRAGDLTPRGDMRPEVLELTSVKTPGTPCIDNCCPTWTNCSQDSTMLALRSPGRVYREEEPLLPPREGDSRLGVNQNYDRMSYSIPLANLP
ncbi:hypothetical protein JG688_00005812 [Phytophthora aleatoria]|uniref:Uncharacterized protein n=1 Tax=Phytophthora aleatoria TaxID=2496075 RepID=A0A8J5M9R1_9STRA|nr:hypothetical protein JG688_00005812 [Phytophthora aleatoria]